LVYGPDTLATVGTWGADTPFPVATDVLFRAEDAVRQLGTGVNRLAALANLLNLGSKLDVDLPLVDDSILNGLNRDGTLSSLGSPLQHVQLPVGTSLPDVRRSLADLGFTDIYAGLTPDSDGSLIRATYRKAVAVDASFAVGGKTQFSYFDDQVNG